MGDVLLAFSRGVSSAAGQSISAEEMEQEDALTIHALIVTMSFEQSKIYVVNTLKGSHILFSLSLNPVPS